MQYLLFGYFCLTFSVFFFIYVLFHTHINNVKIKLQNKTNFSFALSMHSAALIVLLRERLNVRSAYTPSTCWSVAFSATLTPTHAFPLHTHIHNGTCMHENIIVWHICRLIHGQRAYTSIHTYVQLYICIHFFRTFEVILKISFSVSIRLRTRLAASTLEPCE